MSLRFTRPTYLVLALFVMLAFPLVSYATGAVAGPTTGEAGIAAAKGIYCGTKTLLEGQLGLLIGMLFVISGLWMLIQGKGVPAALVLLVFGAVVTAIPGMVESSLKGLSSMFYSAGISSKDTFSSLATGCGSGGAEFTTPKTGLEEDEVDDGADSFDTGPWF